jgi:D-aminopeptidase
MFKKTYSLASAGAAMEMAKLLSITHVIAAKNANDLSAAVQLDEQAAVKILRQWLAFALL